MDKKTVGNKIRPDQVSQEPRVELVIFDLGFSDRAGLLRVRQYHVDIVFLVESVVEFDP